MANLDVLQGELHACSKHREAAISTAESVTSSLASISGLRSGDSFISDSTSAGDNAAMQLTNTAAYLSRVVKACEDARKLSAKVNSLKKSADSVMALQTAVPELRRLVTNCSQGMHQGVLLSPDHQNQELRSQLQAIAPRLRELICTQFKDRTVYAPPRRTELKDILASAHKWLLRNRISSDNIGEITLRSSTVDVDDTLLDIPWHFVDSAKVIDSLNIFPEGDDRSAFALLAQSFSDQIVTYLHAECDHIYETFRKSGGFDIVGEFSSMLASLHGAIALCWVSAAVILGESDKGERSRKKTYLSLTDYIYASGLDLSNLASLAKAVQVKITATITAAWGVVKPRPKDQAHDTLAKSISLMHHTTQFYSNALGPLFADYYPAVLAERASDTSAGPLVSHESRARFLKGIFTSALPKDIATAVQTTVALMKEDCITAYFAAYVFEKHTDQGSILHELQGIHQSLVLVPFTTHGDKLLDFWHCGEATAHSIEAGQGRAALRQFSTYVASEDNASQVSSMDDFILGSVRTMYRVTSPALVKALMKDKISSGSPRSQFKKGTPGLLPERAVNSPLKKNMMI